MEKLRELGFPVTLIVAWMVAAAYTVSLMIGPSQPEAATPAAPPAIADSSAPGS